MGKTISKSNIYKKGLLRGLLALLFSVMAFQGHAQIVAGKVVNSLTKAPVPRASIRIVTDEYQSRVNGVAADDKGEFFIAVGEFPVRLVVSSVGFRLKNIRLEEPAVGLIVELEPTETNLGEFVVSEEKVSQEELRSPLQIERLSIKQLRNTASFSFYDAVVNLKGVDVVTQSVIINQVNARGFNSNTNQRFRQFADGIDSQAPGLGFSLGNVVGPSTLDIESLELIPGPSTSKYGPGAFNGVLDMQTKNPFDYQGISVEVKGASIAANEFKQKFFTFGDALLGEVSMRAATAIKDKVGFKLNGTIVSGVDFPADNYENIGPGFAFENEHSGDNQSVNVVNRYGDDRAALMVLPRTVFRPDRNGDLVSSIRDTALFVSRRGYREEDLVNYQAQNIKLNGAIHVKVDSQTEVELASFYGKVSSMITGDDRIALRDFEIQQHKFEVKNEKFNVLGYTTMQDAGNTYNVGRLAEVMVQTAKPDADWYNQYRTLFLNGGQGLQNVRERVDTGFPAGSGFVSRYQPNTAAFDSLRQAIVSSTDAVNGARIFDQSRLFHLQSSAKLKVDEDLFKSLDVGARARVYDPESNGTIFTDSIGNDVTNFEFGGFLEAVKVLPNDTELTASLRVDKNENFNVTTSQRLSAVKSLNTNTFLRASLQRGQRIPNIREQFFNQNLGELTVVGGLRDVVGQYDLQGNAFLLNSLNDYNDALQNEINRKLRQPDFIEGVKINPLKLEYLDIMEQGIVGSNRFNGLKPETITSVEFGFKSLIEGKRLVEAILYVNYYDDFIGVTRVVKPRTSPLTDLMLAVDQANNPGQSSLFFISDNASNPIITHGLELIYDVTSDAGTNFVINSTFAGILQDSDDPITPGFNTPPFKLNMSIGNSNISDRFGANITWRFRSEFDWQSNFVDGPIPKFHTVDFQMTYRMPKLGSSFRFGGNNVLNRKQFNAFGGPEIQSLYYFSFNLDAF